MSVPTSSEPGVARFARWTGIMGLAFGLVGPPLSALIMQAAAYAGVQWACGHNDVLLIQLIPIVFLLVAIAGLAVAWRDWTTAGRLPRAEGATVNERTRFIALSGVILSAFSVVLILSMWLPMIIFDPCQR